MSAWGNTLAVALLALVVAMSVGSLMGILRTAPSKALVFIGDAWTELFRNIPLLVQVFLWYYVIPELVPPLKQVPSLVLVVFALGLYTPFAVVNTMRYRLQSMTLVAPAGLDAFMADARPGEENATGEGAVDLFDIDIAL
jgi:glutamate/aspartate transport system permease protein